jgi:hypothetical protein
MKVMHCTNAVLHKQCIKRAAVVIDLVLGFLSLLSLIFKNYTKVLPLFPTLSFYALIVNSLQRWQNFCYGFKHLGKAYF